MVSPWNRLKEENQGTRVLSPQKRWFPTHLAFPSRMQGLWPDCVLPSTTDQEPCCVAPCTLYAQVYMHLTRLFLSFMKTGVKKKQKKQEIGNLCSDACAFAGVIVVVFMCASLSLWLFLVYLSDFVKNFHNLFFSSSSVTRPRACFLSCPRVE